MSDTFRCDDKDTLVAYLYDEIDSEQRRDVEEHLRTCAACRSEVESLRHVRQDLAAWQPPEAHLGFQLAQKPATVLPSPRWTVPALPAWAQAAAAVLLLASGAAIANVQVRYGNEGLSVTTGWMAPADRCVHSRPDGRRAELQLSGPTLAIGGWSSPSLKAICAASSRWSEAALRNRCRACRTSIPPALMRRVQSLVNDSEQRQRQELAQRLTQFTARSRSSGRRSAEHQQRLRALQGGPEQWKAASAK